MLAECEERCNMSLSVLQFNFMALRRANHVQFISPMSRSMEEQETRWRVKDAQPVCDRRPLHEKDARLLYKVEDLQSAPAPPRRPLMMSFVEPLVIGQSLNVQSSGHRCGLTNEDLNRRWSKPSPVLHPSIYHTKGLIEYLVRVWKKPPLVYCDYHGHSRKKNVFFYGCAGAESWCSNDRLVQDEPVKYLMLPALMHRISAAFALGSCSFRVERERESTARVTVWRHLGVTRSYTMEASFCGFDRGPYKGLHLNTQHLQSVGSDFCEALNGLGDNAANVDIQLTKDLNDEIAVDSEPGSGSDSVLKTDSDEDFD
ncbi:unnamed protein product, partial [Brenthis ino]